jgi:LysR family transcriptional regulator, transcriptional activator of nhaA
MMEWLNYHHLYYFWWVAREGSIAAASKRLRVSQPTLSQQVRALEGAFGEPLFERVGRGLRLTPGGRTAFRYADEIFSLGRELQDAMRGRPTGRPERLAVGVADVVPKPVAYRLLAPALRLPSPVRLVCHEGAPERLLAELALQGLDLVLSDAPLAPGAKLRAFSHLLGESPVVVFGSRPLAQRYAPGFPASLAGAPFLMPVAGGALRRALDQWFAERDIAPEVAGEFEDSALLQAFGQAGVGLFAGPSALGPDIGKRYDLAVVGELSPLTERYYAISGERRIKHPAVAAVAEAARRLLPEG